MRVKLYLGLYLWHDKTCMKFFKVREINIQGCYLCQSRLLSGVQYCSWWKLLEKQRNPQIFPANSTWIFPCMSHCLIQHFFSRTSSSPLDEELYLYVNFPRFIHVWSFPRNARHLLKYSQVFQDKNCLSLETDRTYMPTVISPANSESSLIIECLIRLLWCQTPITLTVQWERSAEWLSSVLLMWHCNDFFFSQTPG